MDPKSNDDNSTVSANVDSTMANDDIQTPDPSQQVSGGVVAAGTPLEEPVTPMPDESTSQPPVAASADEAAMPSEPTATMPSETAGVSSPSDTGESANSMPSQSVPTPGASMPEEPGDNGGQTS